MLPPKGRATTRSLARLGIGCVRAALHFPAFARFSALSALPLGGARFPQLSVFFLLF